MSPAVVAELLLVTAGWTACLFAAWKGYHSRRAPHDRGLRLITAFVATLVVAIVIANAGDDVDGEGGLFGPGSGVLLRNLAYTVSYFFMTGFALHAAALDRARMRLLLQRVPTALTIVALIVFWVLSARQDRAALFSTDGLPAGMAGFWTVAVLNTGYTAGLTAWLLWRAAAVSESWTRRGLRMASIGIGATLPANTVPRLITIVLAAGHHRTPPAVLNAVGAVVHDAGFLVLLLGWSLPGAVTQVAAVRQLLRYRRLHARIRPLAERLREEFPGYALTDPDPGRPRWSLAASRGAFYRRLVECRDGLVLLSPHVQDPHDDDPAGQARAVIDALERHRAGARQPGPPGPVIAPSDGASAEEDARRLAALAEHLPPPGERVSPSR